MMKLPSGRTIASKKYQYAKLRRKETMSYKRQSPWYNHNLVSVILSQQ